MNKPRFLVIGWDGATFDIIAPLVASGRMPNVASIMRQGSWGRLESTVPPLTPIAWTSISTGVNPGKHGIFDAMMYSPKERRVKFINATSRKVKPIWSLLSERGKTVGVMNVPVTYPVDTVNGPFIAGMFTPAGVTDFMHPPELKARIEKKFGRYLIECRHEKDPSDYLDAIIDVEVEFRERVASHLMDICDWDFFFLVFMASDRVQHFFWKYLDTSHPEHARFGDAIARVYERLDHALGTLMEQAGPDATIIMVSDHGSGPLTSAFFLNNWLIKNDYLHLRQDLFDAAREKTASPLASLTKKALKKFIPAALRSRLKFEKQDAVQEELNFFYSLIDWERTTAFSEGVAGGIYVNPHTVTAERIDGLLDGLKQGLLDVRDPSGNRVIKNVIRGSDAYHGDFVSEAPDLIVLCDAGYQMISPNEFFYFNRKFEDSLFLDHRWSGRHEQHGILLAKGPQINAGVELQGCRIIDVAPTLLYLMGEPVPEHMDGRVLREMVDADLLRRNPVLFTAEVIAQQSGSVTLSEEEERRISEQLKSLGYME